MSHFQHVYMFCMPSIYYIGLLNNNYKILLAYLQNRNPCILELCHQNSNLPRPIMPHTSHKKHRVPPAKRREITDLHGWTHVTRSPNSNSNKCLTRPDVLQPTTIPSGLTLENVEARYQEYSRRWKASTCWSDMERFFRQTILASDSLTITSCVCLGLGSFTGSHVSSSLQSSGTDASMYELVALKTMLDLLRGALVACFLANVPHFAFVG